MNTHKHTPGPWHLRGSQILTSPRNIIGEAFRCGSVENQEANARLIAASPDLIGLLKDGAFQLSRLTGQNLEAYARSFAAIANSTVERILSPETKSGQ